MSRRTSVYFHEARRKFPTGRDHVVFKYPANQKQSFAQWDWSRIHVGPVHAHGWQRGDDAPGSHIRSAS